jgi:integral membrane protein
VTSDPIIIAIGLGVGALFVRSMTIYLVEKGTLQELRYLDHGAHWAIGVLALMLIATLKWDIPDYVIGLSGIVFIAGSVISSRRANRAEAAENDGDAKEPVASGSSTD